MWCDTCDFLRYNSCQSCLSLFSWSFLSRHARSSMNHCRKWPNYDFCISQSNVATVLKSGGQKYSDLCQFFSDVAGQKLLKSANTARSYSKNKKVARFMDHGVTWVWTYVQVAKLKNSSCRQFGMRGQTQVHSASFQMWTPEQRRACSHNS